MSAQDLHAFLKALSGDMEMQRDMCSYVSLQSDPDPLAAIADFADASGYVIDTRDLLALDTVLDTSSAKTPARIVAVLVTFSHHYLTHCHDPRNYSPVGYFDPDKRELWQVH